MKKTSIITLLLLLLLTLSLAVGCVDEGKTPSDSDGETTDAVTEAETTLADIPAGDALNLLLGALESEDGTEEETFDNGKIDVDMTIGISVNMEGVQNTTTLPIKLTIVMAGDDMRFDGNLLGSGTNMIYKDGMLYLSAIEDVDAPEKIKCALTPEEFEIVAGIIFGTENDPDHDDLTMPEMPGIQDLKPSDLFSTVVSELDETGGLIITGKGFNTALASDLAPLLQPMLEGLGLVGGGDWDENGELVTDPAATLAEVVAVLRGLNEDTLQLGFIFDKDGSLISTTVNVMLTVDDDEGTTTEMSLKGSFSVVEGGQTVTAPADADSYSEEDWRVVFDQETAEMLDLIPDGTGSVTLSDDPARRERQILYIYNHHEEFAGVLFNLSGYLVDTYIVDEETATHPSHIGALEGLISLRNPATEEEDYTTIITFQLPLDKKGDGYPADGTFVKVTASKLEIVEDSAFGSYMYILVAEYTA